MKELTLLAAILVISSAAIYTLHYFIFRYPPYIFIFLVGDVAFVFQEVLLVGLVRRTHGDTAGESAMLHKLNTVTGVFFNEVGTSPTVK